MAIQRAGIPVDIFRRVVAAALKFPPSASIAASEVLTLEVSTGRFRASVGGLVVSSSALPVEGALGGFSCDYRGVQAYAAICPEGKTVEIEISEKNNEVRLNCGRHKLVLALSAGSVVGKPKMNGHFFEATEETAAILKWLSKIAEQDEAKPDMGCVYVKGGAAMAGNQTCIAVHRHDDLPEDEFPLPLSVCAVIGAGDKLSKAEGGLILQSGCGVSQIPFQAASVGFPIAVVERLLADSVDVYGVVKASVMAGTFKEAADCVARIPKTQAAMTLNFTGGKIGVQAQSQTAKFSTVMAGKIEMEGELILQLPEAENAIAMFSDENISCGRLQSKGETILKSKQAQVFFAPVRVQK